MFTSLQLHLAKVFLKIFLRNRQAILFSLFFPLIFIGAFSFSGSERDPFVIGISDMSKSSISSDFIESLQNDKGSFGIVWDTSKSLGIVAAVAAYRSEEQLARERSSCPSSA